MKTAIISSVATIFVLCFSIPCSTAVVIPGEVLNYTNQDEGENQPPIAAGMVNDGENTAKQLNMSSGVPGEYEFTQEEIEKNRIITIDWYGNERVSTDEEVIQTLEYVHRDNSTFLSDEPHFTEDVNKRDIIGSDNRFPGSEHRVMLLIQ